MVGECCEFELPRNRQSTFIVGKYVRLERFCGYLIFCEVKLIVGWIMRFMQYMKYRCLELLITGRNLW